MESILDRWPEIVHKLDEIGQPLVEILPQGLISSKFVQTASTIVGIPVGVTVLLSLLAALLLTLLTLLATLAFLGGGKKYDTIVLLGLSGAGKTSLWYKLKDGSTHGGTVTSMEANDAKFPLHSNSLKDPKPKPVHIVDVPGHPRLRSLLSTYLSRAAGIIFLVDSVDFTPHIRAASEFLFEILTSPTVTRRKVPVLIACNKSEKVTAHSIDFIRKQLAKELEKLRSSRQAMAAEQTTTVVDGGANWSVG